MASPLLQLGPADDQPASGEIQPSIVRSNSNDLTPTQELYGEWQEAYRIFNARLFGGELPECIITMTRRRGVMGYFRHDSFESTAELVVHGIAINPAYIAPLGVVEAYSTLGHEMGHLWRHVLGPLNSKGQRGTLGYHDRAWADKVESIGLMPSSTGAPGRDRTGYMMNEYIIEGGPFDLLCRELLISDFTLTWREHVSKALVPFDETFGTGDAGALSGSESKADRRRFSCEDCKLNAWAKPSAKLVCGFCGRAMTITG